MNHLGRIGKASALALALPALAGAASQDETGREPVRAFVWKSTGAGYLGVRILDLTPELRQHFGAPRDAGVLVSRVEEKSPAAEAGVLVGDVLTGVDGEVVSDSRSLSRAVRAKKAGESVLIDVRRDRSSLSLSATIDERARSVVDLADFQVHLPPLPELAGSGVFIAGPGPHLDEEALRAFEQSMKEIEERFESKEWQEKLKRLRELDLTKVQERMKEVEERLRKLEKELEKEPKKELKE